TARHTRNMNEFTRAFRERLGALGRVHDLLRPDRPGNPDLRHLIMEVLAAYTPETTGALTLDGPAVPVARDDAVLLSLFMNELATNATKYGAWSTARGRVTVNWAMETQDDGQQSLLIRWHEENGPAVMPPDRVGFGTNVMRFAVERSMGGSVTLNYPKSGASHEIRLPWGRVVDPHAPFGQIPNKFS
ncbi:MAG: sensor histidine kinase, partial [Beijerinckiaceae bacterium]